MAVTNPQKPKLRLLSDKEREILVECYCDVYAESVFHDSVIADNLYEDLLQGGQIWIQVGV